MTFHKVLIANRGEIACRIMRTCREMGYQTVAVFSDADSRALFVREADEAIWIGPSSANESYLSIDAIIGAAKKSGADAIHPGYGFLSENAAFAQRCIDEKIVFVGPSPEAIAKMGSKADARQLMRSRGVPVVPGYDGDDQNMNALLTESRAIGFPVLLKPALGGGGKGMRVVHDTDALEESVLRAKREAMSSCGDDRLVIEKYIERPRHIEFQVVGDQHGNLIHCFERDCTLQRRHQKIIEESPSTALSEHLRQEMAHAAIEAARAVNYDSVGTVEFILDPRGQFYFLEMNTRLQVEHPVTEAVLGIDLVRLQLDIAAGQKLPYAQVDMIPRGHAIECRLYAEDARKQFLPSTGVLRDFFIETTSQIRVDSGVQSFDEVSIHYDPMLAKIIASGKTRDEANRCMMRALEKASILGVETNRQFLIEVLNHPRWKAGEIDTHFVEDEHWQLGRPTDEDLKLAAIAATLLEVEQRSLDKNILPGLPLAYRNNRWRDCDAIWNHGDRTIEIAYRKDRDGKFMFVIEGQTHRVEFIDFVDATLKLRIDHRICCVRVAFEPDRDTLVARAWISVGSHGMLLKRKPRFEDANVSETNNSCVAPMPGRVLQVFASIGQAVRRGQPMVTLEAMKMEHTIASSADGVVSAILVKPGQLIDVDARLIELEEIQSS